MPRRDLMACAALLSACTAASGRLDPDPGDPVGLPCATDADCDDGRACSLDLCDPATSQCSHAVAPAATVCRVAAADCDAEETCDGISADCPPDLLAAGGTTCRTDCCLPALCDGAGPVCPGTICCFRSDDFNRADSNSIGGSWEERETAFTDIGVMLTQPNALQIAYLFGGTSSTYRGGFAIHWAPLGADYVVRGFNGGSDSRYFYLARIGVGVRMSFTRAAPARQINGYVLVFDTSTDVLTLVRFLDQIESGGTVLWSHGARWDGATGPLIRDSFSLMQLGVSGDRLDVLVRANSTSGLPDITATINEPNIVSGAAGILGGTAAQPSAATYGIWGFNNFEIEQPR